MSGEFDLAPIDSDQKYLQLPTVGQQSAPKARAPMSDPLGEGIEVAPLHGHVARDAGDELGQFGRPVEVLCAHPTERFGNATVLAVQQGQGTSAHIATHVFRRVGRLRKLRSADHQSFKRHEPVPPRRLTPVARAVIATYELVSSKGFTPLLPGRRTPLPGQGRRPPGRLASHRARGKAGEGATAGRAARVEVADGSSPRRSQ